MGINNNITNTLYNSIIYIHTHIHTIIGYTYIVVTSVTVVLDVLIVYIDEKHYIDAQSLFHAVLTMKLKHVQCRFTAHSNFSISLESLLLFLQHMTVTVKLVTGVFSCFPIYQAWYHLHSGHDKRVLPH